MLSAQQLDAYQRSRRPGADRSVICHAPFVALNFDQSGTISACCYNRRQKLGSYPAQSLDEAWRGAPLAEMRRQFLEARESPGCQLCFHQIAEGAFANALTRNFDVFACDADYRPALEMPAPLVLEFEISNACNLECVMCSGHWSSRIRAHREHLPPLANPYDDAFVEQLTPFLRNIRMAKFLGGEPFLIRRYYQIWERLRELNPRVQISVTTNATALPARAKAMLDALDTHVTVSIDAVTKATYEAIRRNAHYETVMENVDYLHRYALERGTGFSLVVCPMTLNWRELPEILAFAEARERVTLSFNTVVRPHDVSLWSYSSDALAEVVDLLARQRPSQGTAVWTRDSREHWEGLVRQLEGWRDLRRKVEERRRELPGPRESWERMQTFSLPGEGLAAAQRMARHLAGFEASSLTDVPEMSAALLEEEIDEQSVDDLDGIELRVALYLASQMLRAGGAAVDENRVREDLEYLRAALDALAAASPEWAVTLTEDLRDKVRRGYASLASEEVDELARRWRRAQKRIAEPGPRFAELNERLTREPELLRALATDAPPDALLRALLSSREACHALPEAERDTLAFGLLTLPTDDLALALACVRLIECSGRTPETGTLAEELAFLRGRWPRRPGELARELRENLERGRFDRAAAQAALCLERRRRAQDRVAVPGPRFGELSERLAREPALLRALSLEAPPDDLLRTLVASRDTYLATAKAERDTLAHGLLTLPTDDMALAFACVHMIEAGGAPADARALAEELAFLRGEWPAFERHFWDWARELRENLECGRFDRAVDEVELFLGPWRQARARLAGASPLAEEVNRFLSEHPRVADHFSSGDAREHALRVVSLLRERNAPWTLPARPAHVFPMGSLTPIDILAASHVVGIVLERAQSADTAPLDETFLGIELRALARRLRIWRTKHAESFPPFEADLGDHFERGDAAWCAEQCARLLATRRMTWEEKLYRLTRGIA